MNFFIKRWFKPCSLLVMILVLVTFIGCGSGSEDVTEASKEGVNQNNTVVSTDEGETTDTQEKTSIVENVTTETDTEWVIYWYLCGSDLETNYGAATLDLLELMEVQLPENVKVVIQTGGANQWQNDLITSDNLGRYVYDSSGLSLIEELPLASMGDSETLTDFLQFARTNYPGKRTAVILWNHGGGSVSGAAFDEVFGMDSLTLEEMKHSFVSVFGENADTPPVDIIGFDACLMATIDTAYTFVNIGKYLVASQEVEPGNGWLYSGFMSELAKVPDMEPLMLSKVICDSYLYGCELVGTQDNITLSTIDLTKIGGLITAYDNFGKEALSKAVENSSFFARFSQIANTVENFGGNTREQGYTNMTDLGHLAIKSAELLPETSSSINTALEDCVVYKVNGKYRPESAGLSCYYSYNGDVEDFNIYKEIGPSESFKHLYTYGLTGELSTEGMNFIEEMNYTELPELMTLESVGWMDAPVTVDEEGSSTLNLGSDAINILSSITFELYYVSPEDDIMLCLGSDNNIIADWENGIFKDNFSGVWGSIDGALCYIEIAYEGDSYNLYSVPILLNGESYNLSVIYDFATEQYYIEGARKSITETGAADKNLRYLVEGDEIQTIHYANVISEESGEFTEVPIDTIIVTSETMFSDIDLGDGYFIMMYIMKDSQGNMVSSVPVTFETVEGVIYTTVE